MCITCPTTADNTTVPHTGENCAPKLVAGTAGKARLEVSHVPALGASLLPDQPPWNAASSKANDQLNAMHQLITETEPLEARHIEAGLVPTKAGSAKALRERCNQADVPDIPPGKAHPPPEKTYHAQGDLPNAAKAYAVTPHGDRDRPLSECNVVKKPTCLPENPKETCKHETVAANPFAESNYRSHNQDCPPPLSVEEPALALPPITQITKPKLPKQQASQHKPPGTSQSFCHSCQGRMQLPVPANHNVRPKTGPLPYPAPHPAQHNKQVPVPAKSTSSPSTAFKPPIPAK